MYEKGQYIVYGIRGVCKVTDIITGLIILLDLKGVFIMSFVLVTRRMGES